MQYQSLLKYYLECLKFESYFSSKITQKQIDEGIIEDLTFESKPKIIEKLRKKTLENNEGCFIGFPIIYHCKEYIPICIWEYEQSSETIFPSKEIYFHQVLYQRFTEPELDEFKELIQNKSRFIFELQDIFKEIIKSLDLTNSNVIWKPVIFISNKYITSNYQVIEEIQKLIKKEHRLSPVSEAYFSHDISNIIEVKNIYHVIHSNLPQNIAITCQSELITVIQGPPGTGKTQTILNLVANQLIEGKNVLVSSTNNQAVDNIIEKIKNDNLDKLFPGYIRFGNRKNIEQIIPSLSEKLNEFREYYQKLPNKKTIKVDIIKLKSISNKLYDQIKSIEEAELKYDKLIEEKERLAILKKQLQSRVKRNNLEYLLEYFSKNKVDGSKIEEVFTEILLMPETINKPSSFFRKIVYWLEVRYYKTIFPAIKKKLIKARISNINDIITQINPKNPLESIAKIHDVIKYHNVLINLKNCQEEIKSLSEKITSKKDILPSLYKEKIDTDRELLKLCWNLKISEIINNKSKLDNIKICIDNLIQNCKLDKISQQQFTSFQDLFPFMLTSNLSARRTIPYGCKYDLVIVDEASQCSIPSLISLLQIAKRICIIGDEKQLNHITSINNELNEKLWNKTVNHLDLTYYDYKNVSSFDLALKCIQTDLRKKHFLSFHYRSAPSIINFSNYQFYSSRLKIMTEEPPNGLYTGGVHFVNVEGEAKGKENIDEVNSISDIVKELKKHGFSSIGIVTPFRKQSILLNKVWKNDNKVVVRTVHTFQGGQCDVIIFSSVIAPGATSRQINFVQSNAKLINVAITRAVKLFIVVGNEKTIFSSKGYLTNLITYIKSQQYTEFKIPVKMPLVRSKIFNDSSRKQLLNPGEKKIFELIKSRINNNYLIVFPKLPVKDTLLINSSLTEEMYKYYLMAHFDFVIYDKESLIPICAIEYDGYFHRNNVKVIKNDVKKDSICKMVNFPIIRIDSRNEEKGLLQFDKLMKKMHLV